MIVDAADLFGTLAALAVAVVLPMAATTAGETLLERVEPEEFAQVPILTGLARGTGLLLAGLLMYANLDASYFDLERLFRPDGPWNIGLWQFLGDRTLPLVYQWPAVVDTVFDIHAPAAVIAAAAGALALPLAGSVLIGRLWTGRAAVRAVAACAGITLWSIWLTIYLVCLLFWALHALNFWALAVLALYLQYRRGH